MAWVAFDRGGEAGRGMRLRARTDISSAGERIRDQIHREVCAARLQREEESVHAVLWIGGNWTRAFCSMPLVGFLPPDDERVRNTVEAVERELMEDGFVLRYRPQEENVDGLPGREGVFLLCSFWLADCLHWIGAKEEARELFERLLALRNDLGLLAEEYDPRAKRQLGNFPQAFSHLAIITTAYRLSGKR